MANQLKQILITHADIDHAGSLAKLVDLTGAKVYAGKESIPGGENFGGKG